MLRDVAHIQELEVFLGVENTLNQLKSILMADMALIVHLKLSFQI